MTTPSSIYAIQFYPLGSSETVDESCISITNKEILKGGMPVPQGIYDAHMGTTDYKWRCATCTNIKGECPGHVGSLKLKYPVKNVLFTGTLLKWLNAVCFNCSHLISMEKIGPKNLWLTNIAKIASTADKAIKKEIKCPNCGVRKHKVAVKDKNDQYGFYIIKSKKEHVFLYNHEIEKIVEKITNKTILHVGRKIEAHPKKFILNTIRISPNVIRPDTRAISGSKTSNSDSTMFIKNIIEINDSLPDEIPGTINKILQSKYSALELNFAEMVKGSSASSNKIRIVSNTGKQPVSLMGQLKGKSGKFRKNLLGKRTEFNIRSVISGDPDCPIDMLRISRDKAMAITICDVVRPYNRVKLEAIFKNRDKVYPGCNEIVDPDTGNRFSVDALPADYKLKDGTKVFRHLITGDVVNFNRAPSLWYASIGSHRLIVEDDIRTTRMNLSACGQYNADFDGDSMLQLIPTEVAPITEISILSKIGNFMIGIGDSLPIIGAVQDTIVGLAKITSEEILVDKWHTMSILAGVEVEKYDIKIGKMNTGKEIVSYVLPNINIKMTPKIFMKGFSHLIKYTEDQIFTEIKDGKLVRGILDKATLGAGQRGSIVHVIHNEFGVEKALEVLFALQQIGHKFLEYNGFTTGINDILVSEEVKEQIEKKIGSKLLESIQLKEKLDNGRLMPPIGLTIHEYFENEQMAILEPGDDFAEPILKNIEVMKNNLTTMVMIGSKGSISNMNAINSAIGPTQIEGKRTSRNFERGRTSPYFLRWDMDPVSLGYIATSYRQGIPIESYPDASNEARQAAITNALGTSVSGKHARTCIKNLEPLVVNNLLNTSKHGFVTQTIYGESGIDSRRKERVGIPTVACSMEHLERNFRSNTGLFPDQKIDPKLFEEEFETIKNDRNYMRRVLLHIESVYCGNSNFNPSIDSPINLERIIDNVKILNDRKVKLNPEKAIKQVADFIRDLPYTYFNDLYKSKRGKIPEHIDSALVFVRILIRALLCTRQLLLHGLNNDSLELIFKKIKTTIQISLAQPGWAVGIIAAQSITALFTQFILNSKHRAGAAGGTKTGMIDRFEEIAGVRPTKNINNPSMNIYLKEEFESDESQARKLANSIECMVFDRFVNRVDIFFEEYGKIKHPKFLDDAKIVDNYLKYNKEDTSRLSKCCIRFELSKMEMFINQMPLETIMSSLKRKLPEIVFINNPENSQTIIIRCYVKSKLIKKNTIDYYKLVMKKIRNITVRGVPGIVSAGVVNGMRTIEGDDGSLVEKKIYYVETLGTNLKEIISIPVVNSYLTQTDSLVEFEEMYGIEASRNKIILELSKIISNVNQEHFTIFADEMTSTGIITPIQKSGMKARDRQNTLLRISYQAPIEIISDAADNCLIDKISGISGPLLLGAAPKVGSNYNEIIVDEDFIKQRQSAISTSFEEI